MDKFRIVNAVENDVPVILDFIQRLADYEKLSHQVVATVDVLKKSLFGTSPHAQVVFAEIDHQKVGFAIFFTNFSTFLGKPGIYLEDLFVLPEARGQGVGKKLLAHLARLTQEREFGRLDWAVLDWNRPSIDFYESIGAKPLNDWTTYRLEGGPLKDLSAFALRTAEKAPT
jgi:GNAT superfamily N-acetyltransferase